MPKYRVTRYWMDEIEVIAKNKSEAEEKGTWDFQEPDLDRVEVEVLK